MASKSENEIIQVAVAYLSEKFGEHRRARWHIDVEREPGETRVSSTTGRFVSEDAEALAANLPYIRNVMLGGLLKPIFEATNASEPIATIDFTFERDGSSWKHKGFVHTVAERKALDDARAALDGRLRALLESMECDGWSFIRLDYAWNDPLRVARMVNNKPEPMTSDAVNELLASYQSFFAERGHELLTMAATIKANPKGTFELKLSYGVPHAG